MKRKLIVTDFDGTLACHQGQISPKNREVLHLLSERGHVRAIATGRNLFSIRKVIEPEFPIDYVIFTTGAGLIHWPSQKILSSHHLGKVEIEKTFHCFVKNRLDFMIHHPIPSNHYFEFFETGLNNPDFVSRKTHYGVYGRSGEQDVIPVEATQFLAILRSEQPEKLFLEVQDELKDLNVVRATSPFDHRSLWLEVFSKNAAKHLAADRLIQELKISKIDTIAVGNDYNDIDLLNWAGRSFAVGNAIDELRKRHETVASAEESGFAEAMQKVFSP
ncbi:MAG: HAD-IIB family hydrolase [Deltaproteobacteria bacterium]